MMVKIDKINVKNNIYFGVKCSQGQLLGKN